MSRPQAANRPKEVNTSFWLWISTAVLGMLGPITSLLQIQEIKAEAVRQFLTSNPALDRATAENVMTVGLTVMFVLWLIFFAVLFTFAFLMRGRRNWARITTAVLGGLYLVFLLIILLIGLVSAAGPASVIAFFQLLLLIGAIVMMYRPAANAWFRSPSSEL